MTNREWRRWVIAGFVAIYVGLCLVSCSIGNVARYLRLIEMNQR